MCEGTSTLARQLGTARAVARGPPPQCLEQRHLVARVPCPEDRLATNAHLTEKGWAKVVATAPGHVQTVRANVIDALIREQVLQLSAITEALVARLDPIGALTTAYQRPQADPKD